MLLPDGRNQAPAGLIGVTRIVVVRHQQFLLAANTQDEKGYANCDCGSICHTRIVDQVAGEGNDVSTVKRVPHKTVKPAGLYAPVRGQKAETSAQVKQGYDLQDEAPDLQNLSD